MIQARSAFGAIVGAVGLASILYATGAIAGVKDGVDAWSVGDYSRAVAEWREPANRGDADAQFNLAQAYRLGRGVNQDSAQAETLYARAAAQGHLKAADTYGLMLFQTGRREQAMPYVVAAAERGDPRAQYLLGLAHFNGDLAPKDWVRAYALLTLANGAGLPQATPAIGEMDLYIPLEQRQQAQVLASNIRANADVTRSTRMAASDLGAETTAVAAPVAVMQAPVAMAGAVEQARTPRPIEPVNVLPSIAAAEAAVAEAVRATGRESPATAGADFAQASRASVAAPSVRPATTATVVASAPTQVAGGPWKLQLGAFSVAGNADRLWSQLAGKAALAGKAKQVVPAGKLDRLLAAGWPTQASAQSACTALKAGGAACIVTR